ncbi:MAG TPA: hypothetical protein VF376_01925 [Thermoanaerobaculia bacterium]
MNTMVTGNMEVQSDRACVVYDSKTGRILHVHRVITLRGGEDPTGPQIEARALELMTKGKRKTGKVKTLFVEPKSLRAGAVLRVNVRTRTLVSKPSARLSKRG